MLQGDGQPALHKAVLHGHLDVTEHIIKMLLKHKIKVDSQKDQFLRTPLHYAYAMEDAKPMVNLLMDYGASEFEMDKVGLCTQLCILHPKKNNLNIYGSNERGYCFPTDTLCQ